MRATCPPTRLFQSSYHYIIIGEDYKLSNACYMPRLSWPPSFYHYNNIIDEGFRLRGSSLHPSVMASLLGTHLLVSEPRSQTP
jgi:hypothetical protein